ncbi:hypothetical protein CYMTET_3969 [Cymbomonas tetramitiformis]|uniref:Uncharacterized protein n=1 Tax=Cymbomonas tetramitiformis TaxID=36881 RepID=A0AAE0LKI3_9CHLO|nr:hypothetical protein CYMTET_3969 [Cymbomonas tetramitiformis]
MAGALQACNEGGQWPGAADAADPSSGALTLKGQLLGEFLPLFFLQRGRYVEAAERSRELALTAPPSSEVTQMRAHLVDEAQRMLPPLQKYIAVHHPVDPRDGASVLKLEERAGDQGGGADLAQLNVWGTARNQPPLYTVPGRSTSTDLGVDQSGLEFDMSSPSSTPASAGWRGWMPAHDGGSDEGSGRDANSHRVAHTSSLLTKFPAPVALAPSWPAASTPSSQSQEERMMVHMGGARSVRPRITPRRPQATSILKSFTPGR